MSTTTPNGSDSFLTRVDDIPPATVQCHASNLLELPDKTLLCAWFGGTQEGTDDISIYLSRLEPGSSWSEAKQVSFDPARSEQNPVLFRDPYTGTIWLFHTAQTAGNQDQCVVVARTSEDQGQTWSEPYKPFPRKKGIFIRQPIVILPDSTWVLPVWFCRVPPGFRWNGSDDVSAVMYTKDNGNTWNESHVPDSKGCVHMSIVQLPEKRDYLAFYRSRWADSIYRSTSADGINWSVPEKTSLPNPNSGICSAALPNGEIMIVFNNLRATENMERREGLYDDITPAEDTRVNQPGIDGKEAIWGTPRRALSVGISKDGGMTWKYKILADGDGYCMTNNSKERSNRELSYPSILVDGSGNSRGIHLAYTNQRQNIKYVYINDVVDFINS